MDTSYRLVPTSTPSTSAESTLDTIGPLGIHDSLRFGGPLNLAAEGHSRHPLQTRLERWEETQDNLKLKLQKDLFGIHAPVRKLMERKLVSEDPHFPILGRGPMNDLHLDILMGKDDILDVGDVLIGRQEKARAGHTGPGGLVDLHGAMERKRFI